ncbi:hypothetical protein RB213_016273 [Colletotrichum asianum]
MNSLAVFTSYFGALLPKVGLSPIETKVLDLKFIVYNDLALHSIKGCRNALYYGDARIEYLLARGLKEINEMLLCNTWAERYDLLGFDRPDEPVCDFGGFLRETFEYYESHCLIEYSQMTGAHKDTHYPVGRDTTEDGPRRTWDWVTQRWSGQPNFEARKRIVLVMETARLRACGYVFPLTTRQHSMSFDEVDLGEVLSAPFDKGLRGY